MPHPVLFLSCNSDCFLCLDKPLLVRGRKKLMSQISTKEKCSSWLIAIEKKDLKPIFIWHTHTHQNKNCKPNWASFSKDYCFRPPGRLYSYDNPYRVTHLLTQYLKLISCNWSKCNFKSFIWMLIRWTHKQQVFGGRYHDVVIFFVWGFLVLLQRLEQKHHPQTSKGKKSNEKFSNRLSLLCTKLLLI